MTQYGINPSSARLSGAERQRRYVARKRGEYVEPMQGGRKKNPLAKEQSNERRAKRRLEDPEYKKRLVTYSQRWAKKHPEKVKSARLKRLYGIDLTERDKMYSTQCGLCAICKELPARHVDHCHRTGRVRALLCFNCNQGLGQFRDRPDILRLAATYLENK